MEYVKRAALQAVGASFPCEIKYGFVTGVKPIKITVEQRLVLSERQLIVPRRFTDHSVKITGGNVRDFYYVSDNRDSSKPLAPPHFHAVGDMEIEVHGALEIGDEVILIRQQGGQKYLIFDVLGG